MQNDEITDVLNETLFPGNSSAYQELLHALKGERVIGFVGAGVSVPLVPTWQPLLKRLADEASSDGVVNDCDLKALRHQIESDPLEAASTIEEMFTRNRFRTKLASIFSLDDQCTTAHEALMELPIDGIVTLNYDGGLSTSFVRKHKRMPETIRMEDRFNVIKWSQDEKFRSDKKPIVHLHGVASSPEHIVFTADDYNNFYSRRDENLNFVVELWKLKRLLVIGFGFSDPFLIRIVENALRELPSDDRHFALIGCNTCDQISPIERRTFSKKYRLKPIFYKVRIGSDGKGEDHSDLTKLLRCLVSNMDSARAEPEVGANQQVMINSPVTLDSAVLAAKRDFEKNLFVSWTKRQLFVQPRLHKPIPTDAELDAEGEQVTISELISSKASYVISAPREYGATTLCRQIVYESQLVGIEAHYRDATYLPNYRKKIEQDNAFFEMASNKERIIVLDNVDLHLHERLLKEVVGLKRYSQLIVIVKSSEKGLTTLDGFGLGEEFHALKLSYLARSDIRELATQLYDTFDTDLICAAVEKVYGDLIDLCIPLTPANVIMYMSIVHREGDFVALNRLQIMDRYIKEVLRRPSDLYVESFNADNKIDIVSFFLFNLYTKGAVQFSETDWDNFCKKHMEEYLVSFDFRKLLDDLLNSRILVRINDVLVFKYRLFYSYFLGRYVANRPAELRAFVSDNAHMKLDGLIEVISGFSADNEMLVTDLTDKLENAISKFYSQYKINPFDPYIDLEWISKKEEEQKTWDAIAGKLTSGPTNTDEIDQLKKSIVAEKRTENQAVIIREFSDIENSIAYNQIALASALRNSGDISGTLKVRAMNALYDAYQVDVEVAIIFAPIIAEQKYFVWNDTLYINYIPYTEEDRKDPKRRIWKIVNSLPSSIKNKAAEHIGTKKLGELYRHLAKKGDLKGYKSYLNFSLLLRSKPQGWEQVAEDAIMSAGKTSLYLRYMLSATMKQFSEEVNTNAERSSLKRLVAIIRTKRDLNLDMPSSRAVTKTIAVLKKKNYFEDK